ncbi:hypothetical protein Pmani_018145 [Petrolisthes manimaculis]|uniref:Uncharacterized protein n=1 Tax=Petrolisthes manimaculis TaxID=1843537 RepID=A0AAE1PNN1_9EUCA|nr:hypothetical protein Pmani_018145 [Petrolisthes manimaculis]
MASSTSSSSLIKPQSCCLCLPLRTGTIIIGVISLILSLLGVSFSIYQVVFGITEGWVDLVIDFIHLILASILLHGVRTERITLLWTWVLGTGTLVIISIIVGIVIIILTNSILGAILLLVVSACQSYFILVVRSYAIQIATEQNGPQVVA